MYKEILKVCRVMADAERILKENSVLLHHDMHFHGLWQKHIARLFVTHIRNYHESNGLFSDPRMVEFIESNHPVQTVVVDNIEKGSIYERVVQVMFADGSVLNVFGMENGAGTPDVKAAGGLAGELVSPPWDADESTDITFVLEGFTNSIPTLDEFAIMIGRNIVQIDGEAPIEAESVRSE